MKPTVWLVGIWLAVSTAVTTFSVRAADMSAASDAEREKIRLIVKEVLREYAATLNDKQGHDSAKEIVGDIIQSNRNFVRANAPEHFKSFLDSQHPRATVITCSDSRVHTQALDANPDGDLFMIRNIGNQLVTAEGSVEYGVHHLHTPLLLIVGHVACGAIKAASGDYSKESPAIQRELDTIQIAKGDASLNSVKQNVNNQVRQAMGKFEQEVIAGHLTVVGAVYDFRNEMRQGQGKLNIINVNGETDAMRIAQLALMQGHDAAPAKSKARRSTPPKAAASHKAEAEEPAKQDSHKEGH